MRIKNFVVPSGDMGILMKLMVLMLIAVMVMWSTRETLAVNEDKEIVVRTTIR